MYFYVDEYNGYYYRYVPYGGGLLFMIMIFLICCCCLLSASEVPPYGYYYDCMCCGPCIHCRPFYRHQHHLNPVVVVQEEVVFVESNSQKDRKLSEIDFTVLG
ncbi:hypothetical protein LOAG_09575 [Loa loa]|uniref:Uncharacterized protein n=1 Tax=Loa loa TaxID=7209 RepID=A0A1S0TRN3_LOALO|nr:hypothetical protein LOAG_09575 [Loa loa]EFO18923.1 hypothetical protein LOAG_09575 [Loa loa]